MTKLIIYKYVLLRYEMSNHQFFRMRVLLTE